MFNNIFTYSSYYHTYINNASKQNENKGLFINQDGSFNIGSVLRHDDDVKRDKNMEIFKNMNSTIKKSIIAESIEGLNVI